MEWVVKCRIYGVVVKSRIDKWIVKCTIDGVGSKVYDGWRGSEM